MNSSAISSVLFAAVVGLIAWNIKTTQVQKLEIILLNDAFAK